MANPPNNPFLGWQGVGPLPAGMQLPAPPGPQQVAFNAQLQAHNLPLHIVNGVLGPIVAPQQLPVLPGINQAQFWALVQQLATIWGVNLGNGPMLPPGVITYSFSWAGTVSRIAIGIKLPRMPNAPALQPGNASPNIYVHSRETGAQLNPYQSLLESLVYGRRYQLAYPGVQYGYIMACHMQKLNPQKVIPAQAGMDLVHQDMWRPFHTMMNLNQNNPNVNQRLSFLVRGLDGLTVNPYGLVHFLADYPYIEFRFFHFQSRLTVPPFYRTRIRNWFHIPLLLARAQGPPPHVATRQLIHLELIMSAYVYPGFSRQQYHNALATYPVGLMQNPNQGLNNLLQPNQLGLNPIHDLINAWLSESNARSGGNAQGYNSNRNIFV